MTTAFAFLAGLGLGATFGLLHRVRRAPAPADDWPEEDYGDAAEDEVESLEWGPRIGPARYLERFPEGEHAGLARRILASHTHE